MPATFKPHPPEVEIKAPLNLKTLTPCSTQQHAREGLVRMQHAAARVSSGQCRGHHCGALSIMRQQQQQRAGSRWCVCPFITHGESGFDCTMGSSISRMGAAARASRGRGSACIKGARGGSLQVGRRQHMSTSTQVGRRQYMFCTSSKALLPDSGAAPNTKPLTINRGALTPKP